MPSGKEVLNEVSQIRCNVQKATPFMDYYECKVQYFVIDVEGRPMPKTNEYNGVVDLHATNTVGAGIHSREGIHKRGIILNYYPSARAQCEVVTLEKREPDDHDTIAIICKPMEK